MHNPVIEEIVKLSRELVEAQREFSTHQLAHTQILCVLLNVIDRDALLRLKKIVEAQSSSGELQGRAAEACRLAAEIVSLATESDTPPDPIRLFRLIQGGK